MKDKIFLHWIHERLVHVHGESKHVDYLHKLRAIIKATDDNQETPNTCSFASESRVIEFIMPDGVLAYSKDVALKRAKLELKTTSGKWAVSDDFSSENSFFTDRKRNFCRCNLIKA